MSSAEPVTPSLEEAIAAALADGQELWVTLPGPEADVPPALLEAIAEFDAGMRPAAAAASSWLQDEAVSAHATSRTRVLLTGGRIVGFYSLASAQVALNQRDRSSLGAQPVRVPAALVTWIAKHCEAGIDGKQLLLHAVASARRAAALQASAVLVVDPFDKATAKMWRERFGFRASAEPAVSVRPKRLWLPLSAED